MDPIEQEAAWQRLDRITATRKSLLRAGFQPIPTNGKRPFLDQWQRIAATEPDIDTWARQYPDATNTGILTATAPAVDIDVLDDAVATELLNELWRTIGDNGRALVRHGKRPKRAVLFQNSEPFEKVSTPVFVSPNGDSHRVEVLGNGQQVVAFGGHPDTGINYVWDGGEPGAVLRDELPFLDLRTAKAFVDRAAEIMRGKGWITKGSEKPKRENANGHAGSSAEFDAMYGGREEKWAATALTDLAADLAGTPTGNRNLRLYKTSFRMGTMVARGWVERTTVVEALYAAARQNGYAAEHDDTISTIERGLNEGERLPHEDLTDTPSGGGEAWRNGGGAAVSKTPRKQLAATPYKWRDPATIPPRRWIYDYHYIRRFVTGTVAPGALGKSSLQMVEAVAIALGLPLLGIAPAEQTNVWYWNGEDPAEETERRIAAICARYKIDGMELEGRLFTDSGRLAPIKLAAVIKGTLTLDAEIERDICATIEANNIGVTIFDPFISAHDVPESDNTLIDAVAKKLGHIADATNASVEIAHHVRKPAGGQGETTVDDARGASALSNALRSVRVLNRMTKEQAAELRIEEPRFYFRCDTGKPNLRPPEAAKWRHISSVELANGDQVGVVEAWKYPDPLDRITAAHMYRVRAMAAEGQYRKDPRAEDWIGRALAETAGLDPDDAADLKTIKAVLKIWFANGVLATEDRKDDGRKTRQFVVPGTWNEEA